MEPNLQLLLHRDLLILAFLSWKSAFRGADFHRQPEENQKTAEMCRRDLFVPYTPPPKILPAAFLFAELIALGLPESR